MSSTEGITHGAERMLYRGFLHRSALPVHGHPLHRLPVPVRGVLLLPGHEPRRAGQTSLSHLLSSWALFLFQIFLGIKKGKCIIIFFSF